MTFAFTDGVRRGTTVRAAVERHGGRVFKTVGDAFFSAFAQAGDAVGAMVAAQRGFVDENATDFGPRMRAAIHTGTADERDGDYFGPPLNKVARLLAIGHAGQILVTAETAALLEDALPAGVSLRDIGAYHLKDIAEPQRVYQIVAPDLEAEFPPLRSQGTLPSDLSIVDVSEFRPVPSFSGRDDELAAIEAALVHDGAIGVLHGLGGLGKSSVAREYGWRNRDRYSVVWWVNAQTETGIIDGLLRLGAMFVQGLDQVADVRTAAQRVVKSILGGFDKPVLLVFDNLADEQLLRTWIPRTARAIVTSRNAAWSADIAVVALGSWSQATATQYLLGASGRADMTEADAQTIALSLGSLPLALAHAAAALRAMRMLSPQRYLGRVQDHLKNAPRGVEYPRSVFATFSTAIVEAEQQAPGAASVLCFAASFAPDAIPDELFHQPLDLCPEGLLPVVPGGEALDLRTTLADEARLQRALVTVNHLALLAFAEASRTYAMHRLVQSAGRGLIDSAWAEFAVANLLAAFPQVEFTTWPECERLLPHALAALDALPRDSAFAVAGDLARKCGNYLAGRGEYAASEPLLARSLAIAERALGPDHPDVASALNNVAVLHMELGRYAEVEALHRRALAIREEALGPEHEHVGASLSNLAIAFLELGRPAEAEPLFKRALAIREKALGPEHLHSVVTLNGLGVLYRSQRRFADAESVLARVLTIREQALGPDHPEVATSLVHLADLYRDASRSSEAEVLYRRSLTIWERALGPDHPDVAMSLEGLAKIYREQGRPTDAEPLLSRAVEILEKSHGPDHHLTRAAREALDDR